MQCFICLTSSIIKPVAYLMDNIPLAWFLKIKLNKQDVNMLDVNKYSLSTPPRG